MPTGFFLNISNHLSDKWSTEQRDAALMLVDYMAEEPREADAVIIDVQFPQVPPTAGMKSIKQLAEQTRREALLAAVREGYKYKSNHEIAAMVSGEFVLTFELACLLQEVGVDCYCATTERVAQEQNGIKISQFRFVRFRQLTDRIKRNWEISDIVFGQVVEQVRVEKLEKELRALWEEHGVNEGGVCKTVCPKCGTEFAYSETHAEVFEHIECVLSSLSKYFGSEPSYSYSPSRSLEKFDGARMSAVALDIHLKSNCSTGRLSAREIFESYKEYVSVLAAAGE